MPHFRQPLRYNITVQWSDRHEKYICFVGALLSSAKLFAPDHDIVGFGDSPETAMTEGLNKAYELLSLLSSLAILPPRDEITTTTDFVDREITASDRKTSDGTF